MEKQKKKQKGITLIALVISIIVMLILAGVSLNMTVGDNGIIRQAQSATIQNSVAMLQEFLQQEYVKSYEQFEDADSKVAVLQSIYPDYFYIPANEGVGSLRYIVDGSGHALFLIKKSGLPKDIREQLVGGEAGEGKYVDYASLNDVYGVTSDLHVYYSDGNTDIASTVDLDLDAERKIFDRSSSFYSLISAYDTNGDGEISSIEIRSIQELEIDSTSSVSSLNELYNFNSLKKIIIKDKELFDIIGIQNCTYLSYIYLINSTIRDYTYLNQMDSKLTDLWIDNIDDAELEHLCNGISFGKFNKLTTLVISGYTANIYEKGVSTTAKANYNASKRITTLKPLSQLSKETQNSVRNLCLNNMNIGSGEEIIDEKGNSNKNLSYIKEFKSLYLLRVEYNSLESLIGLEEMSELTYLFGYNNQLGLIESGNNKLTDCISSLENKSSLKYVDLENNSGLKYVDYLKNDSLVSSLYLKGCSNSMNINNITNIIKNCGTNYSLPVKYLSGTLYKWSDYYTVNAPTSEQLTKGYQQLTADRLSSDLLNNKNIIALSLQDCCTGNESTEITDDILNTILKSMPQLQYVNLDGTNIKNLNFLKLIGADGKETTDMTSLNSHAYCPNIVELDLYNTYVTDISNINNLTKKTTQYPNGRNIGTLSLSKTKDGQNVNLNSIQNVINGITGGCNFTIASYQHYGICLEDWETLSLLSRCSNLTRIYNYRNGRPLNLSDKVLDLTGLNHLTSMQWVNYSCVAKLPSSLTYYFAYCDLPPIFSNGTQLTSVYTANYGASAGTNDMWKNFWRSVLLNVTSIDTLTISSGKNSFLGVLDDLVKEDAIKNKLLTLGSNVKKLVITEANGATNYPIDALEGFKYLKGIKKLTITKAYNLDYSFLDYSTQLEELIINNCKMSSSAHLSNLINIESLDLNYNELKELNGLKSLADKIAENDSLSQKMNKLSVKGNTISDLAKIKDWTSLTTLDLRENTVSSTSSISGVSNLDILYNLHKDNNGNLYYLYLKGNTDIISAVPYYSSKTINTNVIWGSNWLTE